MWKTLALSAGFALVTSAAAAQPQCNERHTILELLATMITPIHRPIRHRMRWTIATRRWMTTQ